jgi:hypothetical protein
MPTGIGFGVSAVGGGVKVDVPLILQFICELADYEKALHEVEATEESLLATLSLILEVDTRGRSPG